MKHRMIALCAAGLLTAGCNEILGLGGDFTLSDGGAGGATASGPSTSSVGSTTADGSGSVSGTGSGTPVEATCEEYCATIGANCTGAALEYQPTFCPGICAQMAKGHVGDTSGDTVGCRLTKAQLAATDPTTYCQQAGPLGVDGCADPCDAFCKLTVSTCGPVESNPFTSFNDCMTQCQALDYLRIDEGGSDVSTTTGENLNCWLYHLQVASMPDNPNAAKVHCTHFGALGQCH